MLLAYTGEGAVAFHGPATKRPYSFDAPQLTAAVDASDAPGLIALGTFRVVM